MAEAQPKKVLMVFNESRDLPGIAMLEKAVRAELDKQSSNRIEFFAESLDVSHFSGPRQSRVFRDFLQRKYSRQNVDLVLAFMGRDFDLASELPASVCSNAPVIFVGVSELELPDELVKRGFSGIVQRIDVEGTLHLILRLQPETRRVVVIGGMSPTDRLTLGRVQEVAARLDGIQFDFWTNRPMEQVRRDVRSLPEGTAIFLSTVQWDVTGQRFLTVQLAPELAEAASAPLFVLGAGMVGSGAVGGAVVDFESLGSRMGQLALRALAGAPKPDPSIEEQTKGTPMVDWRALRRWSISQNRLPPDCVVRYRPHTLWGNHKNYILGALGVMLAQGVTIAALVAQRRRRRHAEAELEVHRAELAHASRVSTMGQLASAITHELNQPLGAILRNAEAAELLLQNDRPDLQEVRAALGDIRKDDQRAGAVIDRMRSLLKRRLPESRPLDFEEMLDETLALARPDAHARRVSLSLETLGPLPVVHGDRVQLQQVLLNLILNGMDAASGGAGGQRLVVVRTVARGETEIEVAVSDRGAGISPETMPRLFEPFFTTKEGGMGMGLAISRTIIEAHGGKIWAENNPTGGATFKFTLPASGKQRTTNKIPV
jgi:signal transduction histidine kinase